MKVADYAAAVRAKIQDPATFCDWDEWGEDDKGHQFVPGRRPARALGLLGAMAEVMAATGSEFAANNTLAAIETALEARGFDRLEDWLVHPATTHSDVLSALDGIRNRYH